jgi:lysophospholipase L1-like esterase
MTHPHLKMQRNGTQLRDLLASLCNPLEQITNITFIGDSITWGCTLPENGPELPRTCQLSDSRNCFSAPSFVNLFKRHIGNQYFFGAEPEHNNWPGSPSGDSTTRYRRTEHLFTKLPPFGEPLLTGAAVHGQVAVRDSLLGYAHRMTLSDAMASADLTFSFTGESFNLIFTSAPGVAADYELLINQVSQGCFSTDLGCNATRQRRTHNFHYVRNGLITIRAKYPAHTTGSVHLDLEALEVIKSCSIVNQGIIGIESKAYCNGAFGQFGPSVIGEEVNYVFIQIGTNDRINYFQRYGQPNGISNFGRNLHGLIESVTAKFAPKVVLMVANPVLNESMETYSFNMQQVRHTILATGRAQGLDVLDNHALFQGMEILTFTADGVHPNALGHAMIAQNIINALECS